jgi:hypothetical protein
MMMRLSVIKAIHIAIAKCVEPGRFRDSEPGPVENGARPIYRTAISV